MSPTVFVPTEPATPRPARRVDSVWFWTLLVVASGAVGGVVWTLATPLPQYVVNSDGSASTTERGLALGSAALVVFSGIALVLGCTAGAVLWRVARRWPIVPWTWATVLVAELAMFAVGALLGPGPLDPRIIAGAAGDVLPAELALGSVVPFAVGVFGAALIQLTLASTTPEPDDADEPEVDHRWARDG